MSQPDRDLWPENIGVSAMVTPATILKEQAALLAEKTKGLVEADVRSSGSGTQFVHSFTLRVPALDNYHYVLFTASHPIELYPAVIAFRGHEPVTTPDEETFVAQLAIVLSCDETTRVVQGLIAQIQD